MSGPVSSPARSDRASWRNLLADARRQLNDPIEARVLVEEVSGQRFAELFANLDRPAPLGAAARLAALVARRVRGEPLQHVVGHWSFYGLDLLVDGRALVPRPETEILVEIALAELGRMPGPRPFVVLDVGTGSGAIACALAASRDDVLVIGIDVSSAALELAAENRARLFNAQAERVRLCSGSFFEPVAELEHSVALVVSNPPYVGAGEWESLPLVVRDYDPAESLVAGETGLEAIETLIAEAPRMLRDDASLVIELAPHQSQAALKRAEEAGATSAEIRPDLAGRERVLVCRW